MTATPPPVEIRNRRADRALVVTWPDNRVDTLAAEYLRVESPSAEVQGHSPDQRQWIGGKQDVGITAVDMVGHYAVRLTFTDGHDTGLYTWDTLRRLADEHADRWPHYLAEIAARGLGR